MPRVRDPFARACRPRPNPSARAAGVRGAYAHLGCDASGETEYAAAGAHVYALDHSGRARLVCKLGSPNRLRSRRAAHSHRAAHPRPPSHSGART